MNESLIVNEINDVSQVSDSDLEDLLYKFYPIHKADFLKQHGNWQHRGKENRLILTQNGKLVGYCAVIPTKVQMIDKIVPVVWWVDLFLLDNFRGQGLQTYFDKKVRDLSETLLGIPNKLAAQIHKKHNWGVREDFGVYLLPLKVYKIPAIQRQKGLKGLLIKTLAVIVNPLTRGYIHLKNSSVSNAWIIEEPNLSQLVDLFEEEMTGWITTYRDKEYISWRYLNSPHHQQYTFFASGEFKDRKSVV